MKQHKVWPVMLAVVAIALAGCGGGGATETTVAETTTTAGGATETTEATGTTEAPEVTTGELIPIRLQLQWVTQAQFAGYFAAIEQGFYNDVGLDVTIL
ncbi:MAG: hypothetical protein ACRDWH_03940, partial [Acidimicrobiia bacterium]